MRAPLLSVRVASRAAGFLGVTAIGIAALLHAVRHDPAPASKDAPGSDTAGSIAAELTRCRNIGLAAQDDPSCLAAWAENRRRFFHDEPPVIARAHPADSAPSQQLDR